MNGYILLGRGAAFNPDGACVCSGCSLLACCTHCPQLPAQSGTALGVCSAWPRDSSPPRARHSLCPCRPVRRPDGLLLALHVNKASELTQLSNVRRRLPTTANETASMLSPPRSSLIPPLPSHIVIITMMPLLRRLSALGDLAGAHVPLLLCSCMPLCTATVRLWLQPLSTDATAIRRLIDNCGRCPVNEREKGSTRSQHCSCRPT